MIIEIVRIAAAPTIREQLRRDLSTWAGPTEVAPGCLNCRVLQEGGDRQAICYEAQWKSEDDLLRHLRSDHYKRLLNLMDLGSEPPLVEFHTVAETKGLDFIERTRTSR